MMTITALKKQIATKEKVSCADSLLLVHAGQHLEGIDSLSQRNITENATIQVVKRPARRKPVIYLQPPHDLNDISVAVSITKDWEFSAVYPLVDSKTDNDRTVIQWNVAASASGELTEKASGLKLSYLFWEASIIPCRPPTPPESHMRGCTGCSLTDSLTPQNSAVLAFAPFLKHLDLALTSLGLHISARNDFVTFWLPYFLGIQRGGQDIAFTFVPQAEYELAAHLVVIPAPDIVTRIFLLFGGVYPDDHTWYEAYQRADTIDWKSAVGVRNDVWNATKFRVLEWGGMEVPLA
jgi:hypothetical protein